MPSAWENLNTRKGRVLVVSITPSDPKVSMRWAIMNRNMALPPASDYMTVAGLPYGPARNRGLKFAVDGNYGYLAFLDTDTVPPADWVMRLIATKRDLVGCIYHQRFPPFNTTAFMEGKDKQGGVDKLPLPPHNRGDIIPVDFLATGATLYSRACLKAVLAKYPRPFEWGIDIAEIPGDEGMLPHLSEDYMFSIRARDMGYQPWLATGVEARHEMTVVSTAKGLEMPE